MVLRTERHKLKKCTSFPPSSDYWIDEDVNLDGQFSYIGWLLIVERLIPK